MISILQWDNSTQSCRQATLDRLPRSVKDVAADDVWWIDLGDPTPEEEERIFGSFFPVHTLTREDITRVRNVPDHGAIFPKVEEFPDYLFVIVDPLPAGLGEVLKTIPKETPSPLRRRCWPAGTGRNSAQVLNHQRARHASLPPLECVTTGRTSSIATPMPPDAAPITCSITSSTRWWTSTPRWSIGSRPLDPLETHLFTDPTPKLSSRLAAPEAVVTGMRKTLILERESAGPAHPRRVRAGRRSARSFTTATCTTTSSATPN